MKYFVIMFAKINLNVYIVFMSTIIYYKFCLWQKVFFLGRKISELTLPSATIIVFWRSSKWVLSSSCVILPALSLNLSRKKMLFN